MPDLILPAHVVLGIQSLREELIRLKSLVDADADLEVVRIHLDRARQAAEELDRLVPDAAILVGDRGLPRHLAWAEYLIERGSHPDQDAADLVSRDLDEVIAKIQASTAEPERADMLRGLIADPEGPQVEFIEAFPTSAQARDVGKEIAALAPSGGSVLIGVDDDGQPVGLRFSSRAELDQFERRIRGIAERLDPPVRINAHWFAVGDAIVLEIEIPPSGQPFHNVEKIPYLRDGSISRPARQAEILRLVREHESHRPVLRIEPGETSFLPDVDGHIVAAFAHFAVTNVGKQPCTKVRAWVRFIGSEEGVLVNKVMPVRWSSAPEPLTPVWTGEELRMIPDPSKIPQGLVIDLAPGETEEADVAIKLSDKGAWGWTGESYLYGWQHPDWQLGTGRWIAEVTVKAAGKTETTCFELDASVALEAFALRMP